MKIGPKYKIARRLGEAVFGKTQSAKYVLSESRKSSGGAKGKKRPKAKSEYGQQLIEKQKVRFGYGLTERMLSNYVTKSRAAKKMTPAAMLYQLIETRLDNVVYRLGLANSRAFARQMVTHGHIMLNGKRMNVPSHQIRVDDVISVRTQSKANTIFKNSTERLTGANTPAWLTLDPVTLSGKVIGMPALGEHDSTVNLNALIGFYSRV